jgi:3,4-dihydroxy 2-butanone 4-phosphate synthase/GTP cyclohydrolase II
MTTIAPIADAIEAIRRGRMVILVDDEDRENEGDIVVAADFATPENLNFMACEARGLICVALPSERVDALGLPPMAVKNEAPLGTAFTVSVDAVTCLGTGVSASDRARTIAVLMDDTVDRAQLRTPGHTYPLRARPGGVLVRAGQTEGGVDLSRLAGLRPGAVICEVMNPDGTMMRLPGLLELGERHGLPVVTVADLIAYRLDHEPIVRRVAEVDLPTDYGHFRAILFESAVDTTVHAALVMGDIGRDPTLVRVHRADLLTDVFGYLGHGATGLPPGERLRWSLERIAQEGRGVLLYLGPQSDGELALETLEAHISRERGGPGRSAHAMSFREFGVGAQILWQLGLGKLRIIANQPFPLTAGGGFGIDVVEWVPLSTASSGRES